MNSFIIGVFLLISCFICLCTSDPTLYEYYTSGGIKSGLKADSNDFVLNGKKLTILSGTLHYFQVLREQWKDRLLKFKAAGLNAVCINDLQFSIFILFLNLRIA